MGCKVDLRFGLALPQGHGGPGAVPQSGTYVLPGGGGGHCRVRYHAPRLVRARQEVSGCLRLAQQHSWPGLAWLPVLPPAAALGLMRSAGLPPAAHPVCPALLHAVRRPVPADPPAPAACVPAPPLQVGVGAAAECGQPRPHHRAGRQQGAPQTEMLLAETRAAIRTHLVSPAGTRHLAPGLRHGMGWLAHVALLLAQQAQTWHAVFCVLRPHCCCLPSLYCCLPRPAPAGGPG